MAQKDVEEDRALLIAPIAEQADSVSHPAESANPQTIDTKEGVLKRQLSHHIPDDLGCCQRMKLILSPIQKRETIADGNNAKTVITVSPEAFRMLFYIGFVLFSAIAIFTSVIWADIDYDDNILKDRFGSVNICVFYDFPPFTHFGTTLWLPNVFVIVIYLIIDLFRIGDAFRDGDVGACYYRCYWAVTVFEIFAFSFFLQITATDPVESVYWHTIPFLLNTFAQWTLAFKRLLWYMKTGMFRHYHPCLFYAARVYFVLMFFAIAGKSLVDVPNLFGAQLWKIDGLEWTAPYSLINDRVYVFLTMICPPFIYFILAKEIDTLVVSIDRDGSHWDTSK